MRDDVDRKRFLKMAGGAGAASFSAFALAACGSSGKVLVERERSCGDGEHERDRLEQRGPRDSQLRAHARVPGDELLREGRRVGPVQRQGREPDQDVRRPGEDARRSAQRRCRKAGRNAGGQPQRQIPDHQRDARSQSSPTRSRTSARLRTSARRPTSRAPRFSRRAGDPHGRGAPRGDARHAREEVAHPGWRVRQAG